MLRLRSDDMEKDKIYLNIDTLQLNELIKCAKIEFRSFKKMCFHAFD